MPGESVYAVWWPVGLPSARSSRKAANRGREADMTLLMRLRWYVLGALVFVALSWLALAEIRQGAVAKAEVQAVQEVVRASEARRKDAVRGEVKAEAERRAVASSVARKGIPVMEAEASVRQNKDGPDDAGARRELDRVLLDLVREGNAQIESTR